MKNLIITVLLLVPIFTNADDMMQKAMEMQQCVQGIDQAELRELEKQSLALQQEIKSLCDSGKEQQAKNHALKFGATVMKSKALEKMRECSEIMKGMIPEIPFSEYEKDYQNTSICEGM